MGKKEPPKRRRNQLVISLGDGVTGAERKKALEKAASRAQVKEISVWARRVLFAAAELPEDAFVNRQEHDALEKRVEALEQQLDQNLCTPARRTGYNRPILPFQTTAKPLTKNQERCSHYFPLGVEVCRKCSVSVDRIVTGKDP